jgi:hypothetical protein
MPKVYRKKTDLEIALSPFISAVGRMPTPKEMSRSVGGDPSGWGRILKGQQRISGEYHARLKLLERSGIDNAQFELRAAGANKKYGERTRKGRIVPHTKNIYLDVNEFHIRQIAERKVNSMLLDDGHDYYNDYISYCEYLYESGDGFPQNYFEEQKIRRDFIYDLENSP